MAGGATIGVGVAILLIAWLWLLFERPAAALRIGAAIGTVVWKSIELVLRGIANIVGWIAKKLGK